VIDGLVVAGVAVMVFASLGVVLMPTALARLHYVSAASLGVVLLVAAIVADKGASLMSLKAVTLGVVLVVTAPVLAHVGARAVHRREGRRR
jgi:multicomponent Na+:H+ antiporter subunit G